MGRQELELKDYIIVILKRKWVIITTFLVFFITAFVGVFLFPYPKGFLVSAIVQNGFLNINVPVIKKEEAGEIIKSEQILESVIKKQDFNISIEDLRSKIKVSDIGGTDFIKITVKDNVPEKAEKICREISNEYIIYGNEIYNSKIHLLKETARTTKEGMDNINNYVSSNEKMMQELLSVESDKTPELEARINRCRDQFNHYIGQYISYTNTLLGIMYNYLVTTKEFKIINFQIEAMGKKKKMLPVTSLAVVGFIVGILLAIFIEYWKSTETKVTT